MNWKFRAGILSYALAIGIVVSVVLSLLTIFVYYQKTEHYLLKSKIAALDNLQRGVELYLAEPEKFNSLKAGIALFDNSDDSVYYDCQRWGIFDRVNITAKHNRATGEKAFLAARSLSVEGRAALYLIDEGRPLSLVGDTKLEGTCYLPLAGIQSAYINRVGYKNEKLVYGEERRSKKELPDIEIEEVISQIMDLDDYHENLNSDSTITNSFLNPTAIFNITSPVVERYEGNVILRSNKEIRIDSIAELHGVLVVAPVIKIKKGFDGDAQFFATDTLIVEAKVKLEYPSVLAIHSERDPASILLGEQAKMHGWIIMDGGNDAFRNRVIHLENESEFFGMIYCNGLLEMYNEVNGNVCARRFLVNSISGIYENYLMNASINSSGLDSSFVASPLWFYSDKGKILKYLE